MPEPCSLCNMLIVAPHPADFCAGYLRARLDRVLEDCAAEIGRLRHDPVNAIEQLILQYGKIEAIAPDLYEWILAHMTLEQKEIAGIIDTADVGIQRDRLLTMLGTCDKLNAEIYEILTGLKAWLGKHPATAENTERIEVLMQLQKAIDCTVKTGEFLARPMQK